MEEELETGQGDASAAPSGQAEPIQVVELEHLSSDGVTTLRGKLWTSPAYGAALGEGPETPRALVQLTHGMAEYIARYDAFARFLAERGFVVFGQDMLGHGDSCPDADKLGCLPAQGGADILVSDMHSLRQLVQARFPGVPLVMYGHSMGSFMLRCYLGEHADGVACAVLSGTGNVAPATCKAGLFLARRIAKSKGADYRSSFLDGMGAGGYGKKIPDARTPLDWLSTDDAVVDAYIADERCGFMFSAGGYVTLITLTQRCSDPAFSEKYPLDLPLFFVAGDKDPVGECGKGVLAAAEAARAPRQRYATAAPVDVKLYEGMRHEIHNEKDKQQVWEDLASWMERWV